MKLDEKKEKKIKSTSAETLLKNVKSFLDKRTDHEAVAYYELKNDDFAHIVLMKRNCNSFGACFFKFDTNKKKLNRSQGVEVDKIRSEIYAYVVIESMNKFKECFDQYLYANGISGRQYFTQQWEKEGRDQGRKN